MRVIGLAAQAAEQALEEEQDSFEALSRYLREAVRIQVAWVMPAIAAAIDHDDAEYLALRTRSTDAIGKLIANAQRDGRISPDITFGDIGLLLIRLARPLPPGQDRAMQEAVAQRHLAIVLSGLSAASIPLPGLGLSLSDLRELGPRPFVATHLEPESDDITMRAASSRHP